jgi:hypothetical protein
MLWAYAPDIAGWEVRQGAILAGPVDHGKHPTTAGRLLGQLAGSLGQLAGSLGQRLGRAYVSVSDVQPAAADHRMGHRFAIELLDEVDSL